MKQNPKPVVPQIGTSFWDNSSVTEEEMIYNLEKSQKDAVLLSDDKKRFLLDLIELQEDLLAKAEAFDAVTNSTVNPSLKKLIPVNKRVVQRDNKNTGDLAVMVVKLLPPLTLVRNYINDQFEEEMKTRARLRSSSNGIDCRSKLLSFLDKASQIENDLKEQIFRNRTKRTIHNLVKPILLTTLQRERKWSKLNVPKQQHLQTCIACGHKSTNFLLRMKK